MKAKSIKTLIAWLFLFLAFFFIFRSLVQIQIEEEITYSRFKELLANGQIISVKIRQDLTLIRGVYLTQDKKEKNFKTVPIQDPELIKELESKKVTYSGELRRNWLETFITNFGPGILFIFLWYILIFKHLVSGGKQAIAFGKSRAKLYSHDKKPKVTFIDVAGCDEAKEELKEVVDFLKSPQKYKKIGARIPKGVLLYGAPGTGKTLLAKAVAGEAGVPFFSSSGSEFVEMFVGVGASRVRDLFEQGRKHSPCLLFIDELDAVGRHRFAGIGGGHDEREQTLNQLLVELDGMDSREGVILIAATNRPDVLDPALLRPGRFDRHIYVPIPDLKGREEILKVHFKNVKSKGIDFNLLARRTPGFVGADLANLANEAALLAARKNKEYVEMQDCEEAIEKIIAGAEKKSRVISEKEKKIIAYHESGHALVAKMLPESDPVHKVSIIPRGPSLGYTLQLPTQDKYLITKSEITTKITVLLAGRCAEQLIFNEVTTGAQNDLTRATEIVHKLICEYGMSDKIGPITLRKKEGEVFLGRDYLAHEKMYSEKTAQLIDEEVRSIIDECHQRAMTILIQNRNKLEKIAESLIEKEILDGEDVDRIISEAN